MSAVERRLLVVLAHPDDETFGCGGTILLHARAGTPVTYACATLGEMGRLMGRPPVASRESLRAVREGELRAACAVLGVSDLRLLGIWDKTVEFVDGEELSARVAAILAELRPSLVITFHPLHGGHPDHCAIGAATVRAISQLPSGERPRVHCLVSPPRAEKLGLATESVDISSVRELKEAAMQAHGTQTQGFLRRLAEDPEWQKRREQFLTRERYVPFDPS